MSTIGSDLRYAWRTLVRGRGVTGLAIVAFALGIGVTTAVFSIFNSVLLTPLPYPDPGELVVVYDTQPACATCPASFPKFHDWTSGNQVLAVLGGSTPASMVMTGKGDPERLAGMATTASLVDVFGVPPALGRWYSAGEDRPGGPKVVVLSHDLWTRRFNASPAVIGQTVTLDGVPYEILGVMPESFSHRGGEMFVPLQRALDPATRGNHFLSTYARMKKGVTLEQATAELRALGQRLAVEFGHNHGVDVRSYYEVIVGSVRTPLRVLLGAVFLVLLIACANVANLLLASGLARRRELAIRVALGAGRWHLVRQLTAEAVLLALAGGVLGVLLASWAVRTFVVLAANQLPRAATIQIDSRVVAFAAAVSLLVGLACGLWPLVRLKTRELAAGVREGDTRTASAGGRAFGNGLVVAEIALACALLVGAGLLVKNLALLQGRDTGVDARRVTTFDVAPAGPRYKDPLAVTAFHRGLLDRLRSLGTLEAVGMTSHLPMYRFGWNSEMSIEGGNPWGPGDAPLVEQRWILGDYFKSLGVPILEGRLFTDQDRQGSVPVVVINKAMADKFWPGQNAVGKRVSQGSGPAPANWLQVIGVVGNVRSYGLQRDAPYELYRTLDQQPFAAMTIVMRTSGEEAGPSLQAARRILNELDPSIPLTAPQTMETVVAASVGQPRLMSALSSLFAALAGLLAMVGVYGVTSYNVRRQRREFGIRLALGAAPGSVERLVVSRGVLVAAAGVGLGLAGAVLLTRTLQSMLNDVRPLDPIVFAGTSLLVFAVSVLACYLPARAAGRVDPMVVLRDA